MKNTDAKQFYHEVQLLQEQIDDNFVDSLLRITYHYLNLYYDNINQQVRRTFFLLLLFSVSAALIIISGAVGALVFNMKTSAYITMGTGAVTSFITSVLFYMYNKSVKDMGIYYDKVVEVQRIAMSLKAAQLLPEQMRDQEIVVIIDYLLKIQLGSR